MVTNLDQWRPIIININQYADQSRPMITNLDQWRPIIINIDQYADQ